MCILTCSMALLAIVAELTTITVVADITGASMEHRFRELSKGSLDIPVETREVKFCTYHPQGITAVGDRLFLSSVEVVDRVAELGVGHLFEMDRNGALLREIRLGEGALYHPGGIDYDGTHVWVPVAAYRPDSATIVYTVDPSTMQSQEVFRFNDHLGAVSHFPDRHLLVAVSWGARRFYRWKTECHGEKWIVLNPTDPEMHHNTNHYIDYQDMQRIPGTPYLLCSGVQQYAVPGGKVPSLCLGGIDLVHVEDFFAHHLVPVPIRPPAAPAWTQNPFFVEMIERGLRFFFIPEDDKSVMYIFEVDIKN